MTTPSVPLNGLIVDRLRANLRAAEIRYTEADIEAIADAGLFARVESFEALTRLYQHDTIPDYLDLQWSFPPYMPQAPVDEQQLSAIGDTPSLLAVAEQVRTRAISPVELTMASLAAIHASELNAFQHILHEEALAAARKAEQDVMDGYYRGPLHGIPVAVKDLLAMSGTPTTAGSRMLADWVPTYDATAVTRLKQAGAIIVGKTRMSEFAYWPGSTNPHYGPTKNPWNPAYDAGGSSSGSGVATASGMVFGALGTDTGGSIRIPAAHCGIVGLKPTFGRASLFGAVPLAWSLDHIGPMTRTVADAAVMLEVLSGIDPADSRTAPVEVPPYRHVVAQATERMRLDGLRIGVVGDNGSGHPLATPIAIEAWQQGLTAFEQCGATLVPIAFPVLHHLVTVNNAILAIEAVAYHQPAMQRRLDDFGAFVRTRLLSSYAYSPATLVRAQQIRALLRREAERVFEQVGLVCMPTMPGPAPRLDQASSTALTAPFNALGWPAITIPIGRTETLPLGLQLVARPWDEATLLGVAAVLEIVHPSTRLFDR